MGEERDMGVAPSGPGHQPFGPQPATPSSQSGVPNADVVHFISADKRRREGNITACGQPFVYPMRGNGWRVRDISCPACDRVICDLAHASAMSAFGQDPKGLGAKPASAVGEAETPNTCSGNTGKAVAS